MAGTGLDEILGESAIDTVGTGNASVDVNQIDKARYSVQLCQYTHASKKLTNYVIQLCQYTHASKKLTNYVIQNYSSFHRQKKFIHAAIC